MPEAKTVLITGASSGIGRATALAFVEKGYKVALVDIDSKGGRETVALIERASGESIFIAADVSKSKQVEAAVGQIVEQFGALDCAVNNAGIAGPEDKLASISEEDWDRVIQVNLTGVFNCMKFELPQMVKQNFGSIVNITSVAGMRGLAHGAAYTASKHGVIGLTRAGAQEYGPNNIRINAVGPVFTYTPILNDTRFIQPEVEEKIKKRIPLGRFGQAEDIANAITWLCSADARFITGIVLPVDGGMTSG